MNQAEEINGTTIETRRVDDSIKQKLFILT